MEIEFNENDDKILYENIDANAFESIVSEYDDVQFIHLYEHLMQYKNVRCMKLMFKCKQFENCADRLFRLTVSKLDINMVELVSYWIENDPPLKYNHIQNIFKHNGSIYDELLNRYILCGYDLPLKIKAYLIHDNVNVDIITKAFKQGDIEYLFHRMSLGYYLSTNYFVDILKHLYANEKFRKEILDMLKKCVINEIIHDTELNAILDFMDDDQYAELIEEIRTLSKINHYAHKIGYHVNAKSINAIREILIDGKSEQGILHELKKYTPNNSYILTHLHDILPLYLLSDDNFMHQLMELLIDSFEHCDFNHVPVTYGYIDEMIEIAKEKGMEERLYHSLEFYNIQNKFIQSYNDNVKIIGLNKEKFADYFRTCMFNTAEYELINNDAKLRKLMLKNDYKIIDKLKPEDKYEWEYALCIFDSLNE